MFDFLAKDGLRVPCNDLGGISSLLKEKQRAISNCGYDSYSYEFIARLSIFPIDYGFYSLNEPNLLLAHLSLENGNNFFPIPTA